MKILAVTVLTSLDRRDLSEMGYEVDVEQLVLSAPAAPRRSAARRRRLRPEARPLRENLGERLLIVTPGIRPVENCPADDQKRVVDVEQAFETAPTTSSSGARSAMPGSL